MIDDFEFICILMCFEEILNIALFPQHIKCLLSLLLIIQFHLAWVCTKQNVIYLLRNSHEQKIHLHTGLRINFQV